MSEPVVVRQVHHQPQSPHAAVFRAFFNEVHAAFEIILVTFDVTAARFAILRVISAVTDHVMSLSFDDTVIKISPCQHVPMCVGRRAFGEVSPVNQTVPIAVEVKPRNKIAPPLNRLIDARLCSFVLGFTTNLGVLKEYWRMVEGELSMEFAALIAGAFSREGNQAKYRQKKREITK